MIPLNPRSNIEDTIRVIEKIEAEQSTELSKPYSSKKVAV